VLEALGATAGVHSLVSSGLGAGAQLADAA
jgi:hypothetical protein